MISPVPMTALDTQDTKTGWAGAIPTRSGFLVSPWGWPTVHTGTAQPAALDSHTQAVMGSTQ